MTRDEAIRGHRSMWNWLADNPGKRKEDYLEKFDPESYPRYGCYICEYADGDCDYCPIKWPGGVCSGGLFGGWCLACERKDYTQAAEIARQIAELPERKETK